MWKNLLNNWLGARKTKRYPEFKAVPPERFRGLPVMHPELCTHCEACMRVCPTDAIAVFDQPERGERQWTIDYALCIFCGLCAERCESGAVVMSAEYEATTTSKADLRVSFVAALQARQESPHEG
jgi:formate hydrogenlyase subunit 6/NADH:ubiquinone oxidoreductase subunit I